MKCPSMGRLVNSGLLYVMKRSLLNLRNDLDICHERQSKAIADSNQGSRSLSRCLVHDIQF